MSEETQENASGSDKLDELVSPAIRTDEEIRNRLHGLGDEWAICQKRCVESSARRKKLAWNEHPLELGNPEGDRLAVEKQIEILHWVLGVNAG